MKIEDYQLTEPALKVEEYFAGTVKGWGMVQDFTGKVVRRFDVTIVGTFEGDKGMLDEDFFYYDGETQKRIWHLTRTGENTWRGEASDIIGEASGVVNGNAINWRYKMAIPRGDGEMTLTFDDWMYLMNDGVLINKTAMKKFGIPVAQLTLVMQRVDE